MDPSGEILGNAGVCMPFVRVSFMLFCRLDFWVGVTYLGIENIWDCSFFACISCREVINL